VWDWWWYPFDLVMSGTTATPATAQRPYLQARKTTPLLEYYYDAPGARTDYEALQQLMTVEETYRLPGTTPIYALANGVVVAAQLTGPIPGTTGFVLVRHEVFHENASGAINYEHAPTYVWTLISSLDTSGAIIPAAPPAVAAATPAANPSWLNRFILRLRECELAVQFHTANAAGSAALRNGWARPRSGGGRGAIGHEIEQDATAYRTAADNLTAGRVARFPLASSTDTTPVRMCLGDFLGFPGIGTGGQTGIQIEIFSKVQLPVPHAAQRVVSASSQAWWADVTETIRHEATVDADLPAANAMAWHYGTTDFLAWINTSITWPSEWRKYGATGAMPARPITRIVT
ncbi:MAG: hypothetical protein ACREBE_14125, partial [bacterium]